MARIFALTKPRRAGGSSDADNFVCQPGDVTRYGNNTTPGTTDMSAALLAASAQAAAGGIPVFSTTLLHIASSTTVSGPFRQGRSRIFSAPVP